ncbi:MAG TPA: hypothetical protein PLZ82_05715 [Smithellaceae bacterium]|nr:hypothetical protein [Smithellaceae bacterium]HQH04880.1 hypothetical protein [Smithellaceae bacterium]HQJ77686.1 hypothetical protein [Smithellaceae bacterium]
MIIARVVRGIDINHLDLAEIAFLQRFQNFQIFAFDKNIAALLEID